MFRSRPSPRAFVALSMSEKVPPQSTKLDKIENLYAKIQTGTLGSSDLLSPPGGLNLATMDKERGNPWHSFYVKGMQ